MTPISAVITLSKRIVFIFLIVVSIQYGLADSTKLQEFSHDEWTSLLKQYVDPRGYVDYAALNKNKEILNQYVTRIEQHSPVNSPELFPTRGAELAYYINAYNALVFKAVLDRGPETESVWSGLISGLNFFVRTPIIVGGDKTNLRKLENKVIRDQFKDPRIHAALNCASVSCPRLPQQAFLTETLDQQLDMATREFVNSEQHVKIDRQGQRAMLSAIFDWFKKDFIEYERTQGNKSPNLIDYINRYRTPGSEIDRDFKVDYLDYDKRINSQ
ncbi:MAG: DUF547 domain-containing protein [Arenicellales bacterium]